MTGKKTIVNNYIDYIDKITLLIRISTLIPNLNVDGNQSDISYNSYFLRHQNANKRDRK